MSRKKTKLGIKTTPKPISPYSVDTGGLDPRLSYIEGPGLTAPKLTPTVYIEPRAFQKMQQIVDECSKEVGWFCTVDKIDDEAYLLTEVYLPSQEVTAVETDIPGEAVEETYLAILAEGKDPSTMYAWFHSHVDMGVTPSRQDETQVETFLQTCPVFIRGIINKRGEMKVDLYLRDEGIAYNSVNVERYFDPLTTAEVIALSAEIKSKVKNQIMPATKFPWTLNNQKGSALAVPPANVYNGYPLDNDNTYEGYTPRSNNSYNPSNHWNYGDSYED